MITAKALIKKIQSLRSVSETDSTNFSVEFSDRASKTLNFLMGHYPLLYRKVDDFISELYFRFADERTERTVSDSQAQENCAVFYHLMPEYLYVDRIEVFIPNVPEDTFDDIDEPEDLEEVESLLQDHLEHISNYLAGSSELISGITISSNRDRGEFSFTDRQSGIPFLVKIEISDERDIHEILVGSFEVFSAKLLTLPRILELRVFLLEGQQGKASFPFLDWLETLSLKKAASSVKRVLTLAQVGHEEIEKRQIISSQKSYELKFRDARRVYYARLRAAVLFNGSTTKGEQDPVIKVIAKTWEPALLSDYERYARPIPKNDWGL
jgi:hypothetical protein